MKNHNKWIISIYGSSQERLHGSMVGLRSNREQNVSKQPECIR